MKTFYIDGGCLFNDQKNISIRQMISVVYGEGKILAEIKSAGGSSNIAELIAYREALDYCIKNNIQEVLILTDSRNTIAWSEKITKNKEINDWQKTVNIQKEIMELKKLVKAKIEWIPREKNYAGFYIEDHYFL